MASTGNERYLRYILLLGKGGLLVLRRMIAREVANNGHTLEQILMNNRRLFNSLIREQRLKLYPTDATVNANIETLDISLLYQVLTKLFRNNLTPQERSSLNTLKTSRDEQVHPDEMSMNAVDFMVIFGDMESCLTQLASGLGQVTIDEIRDIIKNSKSGNIDLTSAIQYVKELNEFKAEIITELERRFTIVNSQLSDVDNKLKDIRDMTSQQNELQRENLDRVTNISTVQGHIHDDVLDVKSTTNDTNATVHSTDSTLKQILTYMKIKTNTEADQEKISQLLFDYAQTIKRGENVITSDEIKSRIDQIVKMDPKFDYELMKSLLELFKDLNNIPGVQLEGVSLGSVRLAIRCSSMGGLLRFIDYMESRSCRQRLGEISLAVSHVFQIPCSISWMIEPDSLLAFLKYLMPHHKTQATVTVPKAKEIILPLHYTSLKGLTHIWNLFQEGTVDSHMKRISTILTKSFGEDVKVSMSIDPNQFVQAVYEASPVAVGGSSTTDLRIPDVPVMSTYKHMFDIDDTKDVDKNETLMIAVDTAINAYFAMACIAKYCEVTFLLTNLTIVAVHKWLVQYLSGLTSAQIAMNWLLLLQHISYLKEQGIIETFLTEFEEEDWTFEDDILSGSESEEDDDESD